MKNELIAFVIVLVAAALMLQFRYAFVVDSPVVVKIDRWTGNAYIVNSGVWRLVTNAEGMPCKADAASQAAVPSTAEKPVK